MIFGKNLTLFKLIHKEKTVRFTPELFAPVLRITKYWGKYFRGVSRQKKGVNNLRPIWCAGLLLFLADENDITYL